MKRTVLLTVCASLLAIPGFAEKIDLGASKSLHLVVPESWTSTDVAAPEGAPVMGKTARFVTKNGSNDAVLITALPVPDDRFDAPENLKALASDAMEQFVSGSVEGKADLKEFKVGGVDGFCATFTDANLVGKPTIKEDYKTVTSCFVYLGEHVLVTATVFSDDVAGKAYAEGMRIVKSLSLDLPKNSL
jgi:hypothetical protein